MKKALFTLMVILLTVSQKSTVFAQTEESACKVLMETISGTYEGECKKGLAHGKGLAKGKDTYEGSFKKGLPHGDGKYTWENGDYFVGSWKNGKKNGKGRLVTAENKLPILGIWKDDKLTDKKIKPFTVTRSSNVNNIRIQKDITSTSGTIEIVIKVPSGVTYFSTLQLFSESGYPVKSLDYSAFEKVTFPFKGKVEFIVKGANFVETLRCVVEFEILEEGAWTVIINQ